MTNIAEILKNAPEGLKLYSMIHGGVELISAREAGAYSISVRYGDGVEYFDEYGKYFTKIRQRKPMTSVVGVRQNEETAYLLGTTENYDGPYKTWEEEE